MLLCFSFQDNGEMTDDDTIVISRDALSALMINNDCYQPRTVVLQRGKKGFGFVLRGCRGKLFSCKLIFHLLLFFKYFFSMKNKQLLEHHFNLQHHFLLFNFSIVSKKEVMLKKLVSNNMIMFSK